MIKNQTSIIDDRGYNQGFKDSFALRKRMERRAEWMIEEMGEQQGKSVLEIGCGTGYVSYFIAQQTGMKVIGSDLCKPFIEEAREKFVLPNLTYTTLDFNVAAENVSERYDYIIGNGILHHLYYNLDNVLLAFQKILNPKGKIIFMEPNIYNPYVAAIFKSNTLRKWAKLEPDEMAFSKAFIHAKLKRSDFANIKISYKDFLLPGVPKWMVSPSIVIGNALEKTPLKFVSQSLLIVGEKK
jgi:2-polyprenyl-3-methyl-5-hydroxy-6-metoxy-1,4-benzoquinol methylase